ncbi:MAG: tetratricopeptide repeat protein, partial [Anaerolineales bacterium]
QDEVTQKIVSALAINLKPDEKQQLARSPTNNLEAYELFLIGQQHFRQRSRSSYDLAREAYLHAIELDPTYSRPYGGLAVVLTHSIRSGWENSPGAARKQALILAKKAVKLNQFSPQAYWALGYVYVNQKRFKEASAATEKAIALSPSYADGYGLLAYINNFQGHADQALNYIRKAMALNPHYTFDYPWNLGFAYYTLGRYAEAVDALKKALERNENALYPRLYLAASYVRLGQIEDAEWEVGQAVIIRPETTVSHLSKAFPYENKDLLSNILEDLRKAGLPE